MLAASCPTEMKNRLNSFATTSVSLVYCGRWLRLLGRARRMVFHREPVLPLFVITCCVKYSLSACRIDCLIFRLKSANTFQSSWLPLLRALLWSLFLVLIRFLISAVMDGFDLRFNFRVFNGAWLSSHVRKRSLKTTLSSTESIHSTVSHGTCAMSLENWSAV